VPPGAPQPTTRIEIAPRTLIWIIVLAGAVWIALQLWSVILVAVIAMMFAATLDPLVVVLERQGVRRGRALVLVFLGLALIAIAILLLTVPPLISQLLHLLEDAPAGRKKLLSWIGEYKWARPIADSIKAVPIEQLTTRAGQALIGASSDILTLAGYAVTTTFLAIYLLADPIRAKGALYAIVPRHQHVKLARILLELKTIVGGYMRGQLITSLAITVFMFGLLSVFRVDDALAIAMFAGLTDIIPFVGGYIASAPAIIAVNGSGAGAMILVAVLTFAYQEFESRILVPRVYGRVLRLSPAIVLLALLIGGTLMGILGALLALPIAAGAQMVVRELRVDLPGEETTGADALRARDEKAEHIYEELTHGQSAADAGVIAGELAQKLKETEAAGSTLSAEIPVIMRDLGDHNDGGKKD
jgi:predicted PurR-regulated permease PerM